MNTCAQNKDEKVDIENTTWELIKGRETCCLVTYKAKKKKKDDDQLLLVSLASNSKVVKVLSNNAAVTMHNTMVMISSCPLLQALFKWVR